MAPLVAWHDRLFTVLAPTFAAHHNGQSGCSKMDVVDDGLGLLKQPFEGVAGWSLFLVISFALQDVKFPLFALGVIAQVSSVW